MNCICVHHILPAQDLIWFPWLEDRGLLGGFPNCQSWSFLNHSQRIQRVILVSGMSSMALCPERPNVQLILALGPGIHYAEDGIGWDSSLLRPDPANCTSKGTVCTEPTYQTTQDFANQKMVSGPVLSAPPKSGSRWEIGAGGGEQLDDICCIIALEGFENHC